MPAFEIQWENGEVEMATSPFPKQIRERWDKETKATVRQLTRIELVVQNAFLRFFGDIADVQLKLMKTGMSGREFGEEISKATRNHSAQLLKELGE